LKSFLSLLIFKSARLEAHDTNEAVNIGREWSLKGTNTGNNDWMIYRYQSPQLGRVRNLFPKQKGDSA